MGQPASSDKSLSVMKGRYVRVATALAMLQDKIDPWVTGIIPNPDDCPAQFGQFTAKYWGKF